MSHKSPPNPPSTHSSRLPNPAALPCPQGPALLAFNDATFSPADFASIARIGQDSKMARPASIGRFGLGFNSTYHVRLLWG